MRTQGAHLMERDHRFYAVGRDRRSWGWENIPRRSGCGRGADMPCGAGDMRACGAREAQRGRAETACPLTAASPSAWSASPPASSASPTSRNAPCSQETSIVWLLNQGRPSGRSFLLPLRALRPSVIYARLLKKP